MGRIIAPKGNQFINNYPLDGPFGTGHIEWFTRFSHGTATNWIIPEGVTSVRIRMWGAGGNGRDIGSNGGSPSKVESGTGETGQSMDAIQATGGTIGASSGTIYGGIGSGSAGGIYHRGGNGENYGGGGSASRWGHGGSAYDTYNSTEITNSAGNTGGAGGATYSSSQWQAKSGSYWSHTGSIGTTTSGYNPDKQQPPSLITESIDFLGTGNGGVYSGTQYTQYIVPQNGGGGTYRQSGAWPGGGGGPVGSDSYKGGGGGGFAMQTFTGWTPGNIVKITVGAAHSPGNGYPVGADGLVIIEY